MAAPGENAPGRPRRLKGALIASLALNLFLIGLIAGALILGRPHGEGRDWRGRGVSPHALFHALPEDRRSEARAFFARERQAFRESHKALRAAHRAALDILATEPFDREAFAAAQAEAARLRHEMRGVANRRMPDFLAALTPEERAGLARTVRERAERRRRWKRDAEAGE